MKKIYLLLFVSIMSITAFAQRPANNKNTTAPKTPIIQKKNADIESVPDFRNIKWGTNIDSVYVNDSKITFSKTYEINEPNAYVINNDDMEIGTVKLDKIYYIFTPENRFIKVMLIGSRIQKADMKYILSYKFGEPNLMDVDNGVQLHWTVDDVRIVMKDIPEASIFTVEFTSDFELAENKKINRSVDDF